MYRILTSSRGFVIAANLGLTRYLICYLRVRRDHAEAAISAMLGGYIHRVAVETARHPPSICAQLGLSLAQPSHWIAKIEP
jgi:hypothetical protein